MVMKFNVGIFCNGPEMDWSEWDDFVEFVNRTLKDFEFERIERIIL